MISPIRQNSMAPLHFAGNNLSKVWSGIVDHIVGHPGTESSPLIVTLHGFGRNESIAEYQTVRQELDGLYASKGKISVEEVAFTIFPQRYWQIAGNDRHALYDLYRKNFPRIQARNKKANGRGLYFQRMAMYGSGPYEGNQLELIISEFNSGPGVRRSKFQASIFDPSRDHVPQPRLGFPCLQSVSFVPTKDKLVVNALYPTQQMFDKAYGNYLGLVNLGRFMASEMGLSLALVHIFIGIAKLDTINKTDSGLKTVLDLAHSCDQPSTDEQEVAAE